MGRTSGQKTVRAVASALTPVSGAENKLVTRSGENGRTKSSRNLRGWPNDTDLEHKLWPCLPTKHKVWKSQAPGRLMQLRTTLLPVSVDNAQLQEHVWPHSCHPFYIQHGQQQPGQSLVTRTLPTHPHPCSQALPWLTNSPKVGDGPQLMVLSSAATMMLLFLQMGRCCYHPPRDQDTHFSL